MEKSNTRLHDDNNGLDYVLVGDYYFPALIWQRILVLLAAGVECTNGILKNIALHGIRLSCCLAD